MFCFHVVMIYNIGILDTTYHINQLIANMVEGSYSIHKYPTHCQAYLSNCYLDYLERGKLSTAYEFMQTSSGNYSGCQADFEIEV